MKTKTQILLIVFIIAFLDSCQKTKSDPVITLRTRKNRVVGDWKVKSGKMTYIENNPNGTINYEEGFAFSSTSYTYTVGSGPGITGSIGSYYYNMKFKKNGEIEFSEMLNGMLGKHTGTWDFNNGTGDAKPKELLLVHYNSYQSPNGLKTYKGNQINSTFQLVELRNKKMKISLEDTRINPDGSTSSYRESYEMQQ